MEKTKIIIDSVSEVKFLSVINFQGAKAATQIGAAAYVECSARTNSSSVQEVFELASLATMGKLKLQKSYIDLPLGVQRGCVSPEDVIPPSS